MKQIIFSSLACLLLVGCGDESSSGSTASCEERLSDQKTAHEACACIEKVLVKHHLSMKEYLAFSDSMALIEDESVFQKPTAEMKKFFEIGMDVAKSCDQHLKNNEETPVE